VFVGTIAEVTGYHYVGSQPSDSELAPAGLPFTVYSVQVTEVISAPGITVGDRVPVLFEGGPPEGSQVPTGEPALSVGSDYLFLLADARPSGQPGFGAPPFCFYRLTTDHRIHANGWEGRPGPQAISGAAYSDVEAAVNSENPAEALAEIKGQTLQEAKAKILAAIAEGPLPEPWNTLPSATAAPEPSTTPVPSP